MMMCTTTTRRRYLLSLLAGLIVCFRPADLLYAAPGTLADSPLFISSSVQPNIMLLVDDSGSMLWTDLLNAGTHNPGGAPYPLTDVSADNPPPNDNTWNTRQTRRFLCRGYNVMAYDPRVNYTPWSGKDSAGNAYQNMTLTTARSNPYDPASVTNISNHYYWTWTDADGDGAYGDSSISDGANAYATDECGDVSSNSGGVAVNTLPLTGTTATPNSQQNYANWYSYYRRREFVAKRALSEIISESDARVGLTTLHNHNTVRTLVKDIDDISLPVNTTAQTDKATLLNNLFRIRSSNNTPLRTSFAAVGEYFLDGGTWAGSSPILSAAEGGACQQNFAVVMSDGYWNGGAPAVGDTDSDGDTAFDGGVYADGDTANTVSNTLADVAMHYYETDLSALADQVPTTDIDTNDAQHLVTYTVAFGINGTLSSNPLVTDTSFNWPTPNSGSSTTVDDMRHAAWNGRGLFLSAGDPGQLVGGLRSAIGSIQGRVGSAASVAFNSSSLSTNSEVYLALFNSERWSGDLLAYPLDPVTGDISVTPSWSAGLQLDSRNLSTTPRTVLTHNGTDGVAFTWANLTTAQKNDLRTAPNGSTDDDATAQARLGYMRGDRACEVNAPAALTCNYVSGSDTFTAKTLRERASRLGDILHAAPIYVGKPESNWPDVAPFPNTTGSLYSEYRYAKATRPGVIYTGSNDGYLHGFSQANGQEVLAYIPSMLYSTSAAEGLHYLTDPGYTHRYYVDLTPTLSDAYIKTTPSGTTSWKTVLIGGLRGGGRGLWALDVTDPSSFSESGTAPQDTVMWEFTNADDADLGYTYSQPIIVPLRGSGNSIRWAAILGNGYNDTGSGEAKLFILFLEEGLDGTWNQAGGDYIEITTGVGDTSNRNGLASPAVIDENGDGWADRVYAGDLFGNMWAFDLSAANSGNWDVAYKSGSTPEPLFRAESNQQITTTPVIVRNADIPTAANNSPNTLVMFGTGQYLTAADVGTTSTQAMYGVWDHGDSDLRQSDLVEQVISTGTTTAGVPGRTLTDNTVDYTGSAEGWYIDLPVSGERVITDPVIRGDLVFFNTTIPDSVPCNYGGTGWLMVAKWINGGNPDKVAFDLNGDTALNDLDKIGSTPAAGMSITGLPTSPSNLGNKRYVATTDTDGGDSIEVTDIEDIGGPGTGRLSWEELEP